MYLGKIMEFLDLARRGALTNQSRSTPYTDRRAARCDPDPRTPREQRERSEIRCVQARAAEPRRARRGARRFTPTACQAPRARPDICSRVDTLLTDLPRAGILAAAMLQPTTERHAPTTTGHKASRTPHDPRF